MEEDYRLVLAFVERVHRWSQGRLRRRLTLLNVNDIGPGQASVLLNLGDTCMSVTELAQRGAYHQPNLSGYITELHQAGYIRYERSAHDRRVRLVSLAGKGRQLVEALTRLHGEDAAGLKAVVSAEALGTCRLVLQQIEQAIQSQEVQGLSLAGGEEDCTLAPVDAPPFARLAHSPSFDALPKALAPLEPASPSDDRSPVDRGALIAALRALTPEQREALILTRAEDLTYEEAALVCGVPAGTIKSRIARGGERLIALLPGSPRVVL